MTFTTLAAALGTWLGIHAVRMALAMILWNVAEDDTALAGQVAALVWLAGIGGSFLVGRVPVRRPAVWLAALFGALVVLRQAVPGELTSPAFAFAAWIVWLWWLPAFVRAAAGRSRDLAVGAILGVALQLAGQVALHGLDLPLTVGPGSVIAATILAAGLVLATIALPRSEAPRTEGWGAFALGPFLFLELTFLASLGRLEVITGLPLLVCQLAAALGLALALAMLVVDMPRAWRGALSILTVVILVPGQSLGPLTLVAVVLAQSGLALGLFAAFDAGPRRMAGRIHAGAALGGLSFFVLVFVFYTFRDRTDWLWPVAAALVVAPGLAAPRPRPVTSLRPALAGGLALLVASAFAVVPAPGAGLSADREPELRVLTYNLHQGLSATSVPAARDQAEAIAAAGADIVALQEVNRGWDLSAGIDEFAYLRWRLAGYHAVYGPMDTALYGNAILSRYPIAESGHGILPRLGSALPRGYVWAELEAPSGRLLVVSTHFTSYAGFGQERLAQADAFIELWGERPLSILAGDYNARPEDIEIARLLDAGLIDGAAAVGMGDVPTHSAGRIDYVFVSPDLRPVRGDLPGTTASDHRPVLVVIELP